MFRDPFASAAQPSPTPTSTRVPRLWRPGTAAAVPVPEGHAAPDGTKVSTVSIGYEEGYAVSWAWGPLSHTWKRSIFGGPDGGAAGGQFNAANVGGHVGRLPRRAGGGQWPARASSSCRPAPGVHRRPAHHRHLGAPRSQQAGAAARQQAPADQPSPRAAPGWSSPTPPTPSPPPPDGVVAGSARNDADRAVRAGWCSLEHRSTPDARQRSCSRVRWAAVPPNRRRDRAGGRRASRRRWRASSPVARPGTRGRRAPQRHGRAPHRPAHRLVEPSAAAGRCAVTVKVGNTQEAHPLSGVERADVVYEEVVDSGIAGLAAVYQSGAPGRVGPVRSVRPTDQSIVWPLAACSRSRAGIPSRWPRSRAPRSRSSTRRGRAR